MSGTDSAITGAYSRIAGFIGGSSWSGERRAKHWFLSGKDEELIDRRESHETGDCQ
jgi:hypothetical protein